MKKRTILVAVIAAVLVAGGTATALVADTPVRSFVRQYLMQVEKTDKTAEIKVDGEPIYKEDIDSYLELFNGLRGEPDSEILSAAPDMQWHLTREDVKKQFIEGKVADREAKRLGLTVTREEVEQFAEKQREYMKQAMESEPSGYTAQIFLAFMQERGLTEEQYFEEVKQSYRTMLIRGKVRQAFLADYQGDDPDGAWETHLAELVAQADIEYPTAEK